MTNTQFWAQIESAWQAVGGMEEARQQLMAGTLPKDGIEALERAMGRMAQALREQLGLLSAKDLMAFDRLLERKLHDLDREELHWFADGTDDGFLYGRGFIVAAGERYYQEILADPFMALPNRNCEVMCYVSRQIYDEKFGQMPFSDISRESCRNEAGWSSLHRQQEKKQKQEKQKTRRVAELSVTWRWGKPDEPPSYSLVAHATLHVKAG
jgi:hypothetical protein